MKKILLTFTLTILIFSLNSCSENDDKISNITSYKNLSVDKIGKDSEIGKLVKSELNKLN